MANADKCHLNIPFKEYLKTLDPADPASRKLAADREFENYKAIERRVNDGGCGGAGGACSWVQAEADGGGMSITAGGTDAIDLSWAAIDFQTGGWTISSGSLVPPAGTPADAIYRIYVAVGFSINSGPDPIQAALGHTDGMVIWEVSTVLLDGFAGSTNLTRLCDVSGLAQYNTYVYIDGVTPATAGTSATVFAFVELTDCPAAETGGGG